MFKLLLSLSLLLSASWAISCKELNTDKKIRDFVKKTYESHPLLRENTSSTMLIKTNERGSKKQQMVHSVRLKEKKRSYFIKGENAPKCSVTQGERDFICSECSYTSNTLCRSYKGDESSTKIKGTNIDTNDFKLLESPDYVNSCVKAKKKGYLKIISKKVGGNSAYDKIISYYDVQKNINVKTNYYVENVLRKVYQFFPKYYTLIKGEWVSTVSRVRTVNGKLNNFSFETLINVTKDKKGNHLLYMTPKDDPKIGSRISTLFNTNQ